MQKRTFRHYPSLYFWAVVLFLLSSGSATLYATCDPTACPQSPNKPTWEIGPRPDKWAIPMKHTCDVPNFYKINDNLYRSGQPTKCGFIQLYQMGIRTIINLREFPWDNDKEGEKVGLKIFNVRINGGLIANDAETNKAVLEVINILKDQKRWPVLIHCLHGSDRTGFICALYRILIEKWCIDDAINEMVNGGYGFHRDFFINIINSIEDEKNIKELRKTLGIEKQCPSQ
ncbi:MAG: tyrosine-protein phosphatase [Thermodesulfobacteriota bacterium]|jgi:protein tyrosine/serine phosphatase